MNEDDIVDRVRRIERGILDVCGPELAATNDETAAKVALTAASVALARMWYVLMSHAKGRPISDAELAEMLKSSPWDSHAHAAIVGFHYDATHPKERP